MNTSNPDHDPSINTASGEASTTPSKNSSAGGGPLPSPVEFEPPLACVRRILKHALPSSTNVGKDASAAFARACGIFIIYITACANDFAREHKRQTITANDVLAAVKELDFDEFTPSMMQFLESYRATERSKKDARAKRKEAPSPASSSPAQETSAAQAEDEDVPAQDAKDDDDEMDDDEEDASDDVDDNVDEPEAKRLKMEDDRIDGESDNGN